MSVQPDHPPEGPFAQSTVDSIRAVLALYERRRLTFQAAIDEITALAEEDRAHRGPRSRAGPLGTIPDSSELDVRSTPGPERSGRADRPAAAGTPRRRHLAPAEAVSPSSVRAAQPPSMRATQPPSVRAAQPPSGNRSDRSPARPRHIPPATHLRPTPAESPERIRDEP